MKYFDSRIVNQNDHSIMINSHRPNRNNPLICSSTGTNGDQKFTSSLHRRVVSPADCSVSLRPLVTQHYTEFMTHPVQVLCWWFSILF